MLACAVRCRCCKETRAFGWSFTDVALSGHQRAMLCDLASGKMFLGAFQRPAPYPLPLDRHHVASPPGSSCRA
jgi:hypothetical protein